MKLAQDPRLPIENDRLRPRLTDILRETAQAVNGLAEGKLAASYSAQTSAPTTGTHGLGDLIRNSNPSETGSAPNTYVVFGWLCVAAGTPGTWVPLNIPTDAFSGGGGGGSFGSVVNNTITPLLSVKKLLEFTSGSATYYIELMGN
jgi:hypothetical protein